LNRLWVDANVLLRFLTGDPEPLAARAAAVMARAERGEVTLRVTRMILAEVVWVLRSYYRQPMDDVLEVVAKLARAAGVEIEGGEATLRAIELARGERVDLVDAFLALDAAAHDETVCTLDRSDFKRLPVRWVEP
jgi:predicted nucleic acid-binding protein